MRVRERTQTAIYSAIGGAVLGTGVTALALLIFRQKVANPLWLTFGGIASGTLMGIAAHHHSKPSSFSILPLPSQRAPLMVRREGRTLSLELENERYSLYEQGGAFYFKAWEGDSTRAIEEAFKTILKKRCSPVDFISIDCTRHAETTLFLLDCVPVSEDLAYRLWDRWVNEAHPNRSNHDQKILRRISELHPEVALRRTQPSADLNSAPLLFDKQGRRVFLDVGKERYNLHRQDGKLCFRAWEGDATLTIEEAFEIMLDKHERRRNIFNAGRVNRAAITSHLLDCTAISEDLAYRLWDHWTSVREARCSTDREEVLQQIARLHPIVELHRRELPGGLESSPLLLDDQVYKFERGEYLLMIELDKTGKKSGALVVYERGGARRDDLTPEKIGADLPPFLNGGEQFSFDQLKEVAPWLDPQTLSYFLQREEWTLTGEQKKDLQEALFPNLDL